MTTIVGAAGGGNWNATGSWVGSVVPTAADDVQLNGSSGNITVNVASVCRSLDCTAYTGTLAVSAGLSIGTTSAGLSSIALKLVSTMGLSGTSTVTFVSTSSTQQTVTFGTKTVTCPLTFNGAGGSWQLQDTLTSTNASAFQLVAGTLDTNGQTMTLSGTVVLSGSGTKSLTLGATSLSTSSSGSAWNYSGSNLTISAASSTITLSGSNPTFAGGGLSYGTVAFTQSNSPTITGANTFATLTRTGTASTLGKLILSASQTITGTLNLNGNSAINRLLVTSDTLGTAYTLTVTTTVSASNVDFQDITGAGAASWNLASITGNSGDCGGNSGITFTSPTTQTATGTASFVWSTHGWTTHVPLPQDTVSIPNAFVATRVITADMPRLGKDISCTCTGNPSWTQSINPGVIYGSFTLASGMTTTTANGITFSGRGSHTITTNAVSIAQPLNVTAFGGTYTLQDALTTTSTFTLTDGTLDTNSKAVSSTTFTSTGANTRALTLGTTTWSLTNTATSNIWNVTNSLTLSAASGTIAITATSANTRTFVGGSLLTYGTLTYTVAGSTGGLTITGNNAFDTLNFSDASNARTLTIGTGSTQVITNWTVNGLATKLMTVTTSGGSTYIPKGAGKNYVSDYLSIDHCAFSGPAGELFFAGAHSTDGGSNTAVRFETPSTITKTQSATAAIANNETKTQGALARIANNETKTQSALSRIANNVTKAQSALARIASNVTKTQGALSRIANNKTKTQSATSRIAQSLTTTQAATAHIVNTETEAQTAVARIVNNVTKTQAALARIASNVTKTQTAVARIVSPESTTQSATAQISQNYTTTQTATAKIASTFFTPNRTQSATAAIANNLSTTHSALARISNTRGVTQTATARLIGRLTKTQTATASIMATVHARQHATARITNNIYRFSPPASSELPRSLATPHKDDRFWSHFRRGYAGSSVLKQEDGSYVTTTTPSQDQIAAAEVTYLGGHIYEVTSIEAAALTDAGFSVTETVE